MKKCGYDTAGLLGDLGAIPKGVNTSLENISIRQQSNCRKGNAGILLRILDPGNLVWLLAVTSSKEIFRLTGKTGFYFT